MSQPSSFFSGAAANGGYFSLNGVPASNYILPSGSVTSSSNCLSLLFRVLSSQQNVLVKSLGVVASSLLCLHSLSYLFLTPSSVSFFRLLHNFADLILFGIIGIAGIVAEVFPRDSTLHKVLKANIPFIYSILGRALFYLLFGLVVMGNNFTNSANTKCNPPTRRLLMDEQQQVDEDDHWDTFSLVTGITIATIGFITLLYACINHRRNATTDPEGMTTAGGGGPSSTTVPLLETTTNVIQPPPRVFIAPNNVRI